jgi:antirestriction protein ArdC
MRKNIYEQITQQVINNLATAGSWKCLWDVPQPVSLNGHKYQGINYLLLSDETYKSPVWGTFNQVRQNGGMVNKGEKSRLVVFWKRLSRDKINPATGESEKEVNYLLRYYLVFNTEQCTFDDIGMNKVNSLAAASENHLLERFTPAEDIINNMPNPPHISLGKHEEPCYIPSIDILKMPELEYFTDRNAYYAAFFHELIHSTGHKRRLNRFEADQFSNKQTYSKEELVAELGSSFLQSISGVEWNLPNTAAYIKNWLTALKDNPTWITWAASRAQKACEFILPELTKEREEETPAEAYSLNNLQD